MLGLVLCALVVSAALPLREYLSQRGEISRLAEAQAAQRSRVEALATRRTLLDDPAHVAQLARERLHYVLPGETTYVLLGAEQAQLPVEPPATRPVGPEAPWFSQLWGSVREADASAGG